MKTLIIPSILFLLFISCGNPEEKPLENKIGLHQILSEILDSAACIYFPENQIIISTKCENNASPDLGLQDTSGFLRYFHNVNDSIIQDSLQNIDDDSLKNFRSVLLSKNYFHVDSIYFMENNYDNSFGKSESSSADNYSIKGLQSGETNFFLKYYNTKDETWLFVRRNNSTDSTFIAGEKTNCEFFLKDINSDSKPEVFVISQYIMPSSTAGEFPMVNLQVFSLFTK